MNTYSDEELLCFVDGEMNESAAADVRVTMESDEALRQRIETLQASQLPFATAYKLQPSPELPEDLRSTIKTWTEVASNVPDYSDGLSRRKQLAIAAALVVSSFVLGYATSQRLPGDAGVETSANILASKSPDTRWVQRVADYQSLYVSETVTLSDYALSRAEALLAELASVNLSQNSIPDLSQFNYTFARAQQLGFEGNSLVQLVYLSPGKKPLALCFMLADGPLSLPTSIAHHENLSSASWRYKGQRFVIVAEEDVETLKVLAQHTQKTWI